MATGEDWSRIEVEACVADYLRMLTLELNGQRYNKSAHAQTLLQQLDGRSRPSIEFKHSNISAVMLALGYPYIDGYKPRGNYQALLLNVVEGQLESSIALQEATLAAVLRPATAIAISDAASIWVSAPKPAHKRNTTTLRAQLLRCPARLSGPGSSKPLAWCCR